MEKDEEEEDEEDLVKITPGWDLLSVISASSAVKIYSVKFWHILKCDWY